jgi:hypothetical protein
LLPFGIAPSGSALGAIRRRGAYHLERPLPFAPRLRRSSHTLTDQRSRLGSVPRGSPRTVSLAYPGLPLF